MATNNYNYLKLQKVLEDIFELNQADLDFGIYRIMNQKREEINDFLNNRLLVQVKDILSQQNGDNSKVQAELEEAISQAKNLGVDPDTLPKVQELKDKLTSSVSVDQLEQEVYSHLANFFRRYYKDGDFISLRRYKKDTYAIPYEGEEVKLHWANHDQYYIKSSEFLKNYSFKLSEDKLVKFELKEASTEQNNNKEEKDKVRLFAIYEEQPCTISEDGKTLSINFTYDLYKKSNKQDKLTTNALKVLFAQKEIADKFAELYSPRPTEKNKKRTLLEKHINDFTARNTFDYFIHKDLGGFLSRELDFYIKNEVLFIDDINTENEIDFSAQLSKVKALKQVAGKIITFLAQLEDFQKKLWLKKKFVIDTHYCITLDKVPEEYYPEIANNEAQIGEWVKLFAIDEIKQDTVTMGYSKPLSIEFLKTNPYLVLDTSFFSEKFKENILSVFDNIDEEINGLLINSDNYQGLNLLVEKFKEQINSIYIDPPYNTGGDGFNYKDNFKSSSWLSMMDQLNPFVKEYLKMSGSFFASCDENEALDYGQLLKECFNSENHVETITWNKRVPKNDKGIGNIHEYIYLFCRDLKYRRTLEKVFNMRKDAIEDIYKLVDNLKRKGIPIDQAKKELKKYYKKQGFDRGITLYCELTPEYEIWGKINMSWPNAKTEGPRYEVINPVTQEPAPIPNKGWRWKEDTFRSAENDGKSFELPDGSLIKGRIWYSNDEKTQPSSITYLRDVESFLLRSIISLKSDGSIQLDNLGLSGTVDYPKPPKLMEWIFYSVGEIDGYFMDFFAGSGTSAEALINLNRSDNGMRKYILMDMGGHFFSALKPRTEKNIYSNDWKSGKPISRNGISQIVKYQVLESYEDVLNNLSLSRSAQQEGLLMNELFKDEYMLSYMLDMESKDSLLNIEAFKNPFNYKLNITRNNETKETVIDLVETFNYLIGLHVRTMETIQGFKVITGVTNKHNEETLIIWRNTEEKDNKALNDFFTKMEYSTRDTEFDRIYVNGDNHLENLKIGDEKWKVVLIEEEFQKRMFDVENI